MLRRRPYRVSGRACTFGAQATGPHLLRTPFADVRRGLTTYAASYIKRQQMTRLLFVGCARPGWLLGWTTTTRQRLWFNRIMLRLPPLAQCDLKGATLQGEGARCILPRHHRALCRQFLACCYVRVPAAAEPPPPRISAASFSLVCASPNRPSAPPVCSITTLPPGEAAWRASPAAAPPLVSPPATTAAEAVVLAAAGPPQPSRSTTCAALSA